MTIHYRSIYIGLVFIGLLALAMATSVPFAVAEEDDDGKTDEELLSKEGDNYLLKVPSDLGDGISLTPNGEDTSMTLVKLGEDGEPVSASGTVKGEGLAVHYPDDNSVVVPFDDGGYVILQVLADKDAPETYTYQLNLGDHREVVADDGSGGGYKVFDEKGDILYIGAPWAVDADGNYVETSLSVDGDILTLEVDHLAGNYTYPIVADPCWRFWGRSCRGQVIRNAAGAVAAQRIVFVAGVTITAASGGTAAPVTGTAIVVSTAVAATAGAVVCIVWTCNPD